MAERLGLRTRHVRTFAVVALAMLAWVALPAARRADPVVEALTRQADAWDKAIVR